MNMLRYVGVLGLAIVLWGCQTASGGRQGLVADVFRIEPDVRARTSEDFADDPDHFHFAIMSDRTGGHRPGVFGDAVSKLNLLQPAFVMCIGDLIEGGIEDESLIDQQWDEFEGLVQELEMPFFYVPGNHDISNLVMLRKWQERFGRPYYHFVYGEVLFLCLDTEDPPASHISDAQVDYVAKVLRENKGVFWTLVFMHQPLWLLEEREETRGTGWDKVEALLLDRPYTVFAGHSHTYTKYVRNDRSYIRLATTGGNSSLAGPDFGSFDHVVWVTMTDGGPQLANLMLDGIRDENVRTETSLRPLGRGFRIRRDVFYTDSPVFEGAATELRLVNQTEYPVTVRALFEPHAVLRPDPIGISRVVPAGTTQVVDVKIEADRPLDVSALEPLVLNWSAALDLADRPPIEFKSNERVGVVQVEGCSRRRAPVVVDGKLDEWDDLPFLCREPAQILLDPDAWDGSQDSSFRFAVAYDDEFLYVAVETTDDQHVFRPGRDPWDQDGIEVRLDARPDPDRAFGRHGEFEQFLLFALSPGETSEQMLFWWRDRLPPDVRAVCVRAERGHNTEIAVPVSYLNEKQGGDWQAFRLNIAVDDWDHPDGPGSQVWWRPDWRGDLNYPGSGTFHRR